MQEQAAQSGAALAGRAHRRKGHAAQGQVKVRGGGDDGGVVAAEFKQAASKAGRDARANLAPHAGGPCGRNQRHLGAIHQRLAQRAPADQHRGQARRGRAPFGIEAGDRALQHGMGGQGRQAGLFRGLPDHRVAANERKGGVPGPDRNGKIEGGNHADHAQGMPSFHHTVLGSLGGNCISVQLPRQAQGEVTNINHFLHFAQALGQDLADLDGDKTAKIRFVGAQFLGPKPHQLASFWGRNCPPIAKGTVRGVNSGDRDSWAVFGDLHQHFAGDRRMGGQGAFCQRDAKPREQCGNIIAEEHLGPRITGSVQLNREPF